MATNTEHLTREQVQALLKPWKAKEVRILDPFQLARQIIDLMDEVEALRHDIERALDRNTGLLVENERFRQRIRQLESELGYIDLREADNYIGNDPEESKAWKSRREARAAQQETECVRLPGEGGV